MLFAWTDTVGMNQIYIVAWTRMLLALVRLLWAWTRMLLGRTRALLAWTKMLLTWNRMLLAWTILLLSWTRMLLAWTRHCCCPDLHSCWWRPRLGRGHSDSHHHTPGPAHQQLEVHWTMTTFGSVLKGTVSRDFLLLVFFMNQFLPSPRVSH